MLFIDWPAAMVGAASTGAAIMAARTKRLRIVPSSRVGRPGHHAPGAGSHATPVSAAAVLRLLARGKLVLHAPQRFLHLAHDLDLLVQLLAQLRRFGLSFGGGQSRH